MVELQDTRFKSVTVSGIYTIEDLREKGLEEPLVRIPFKISCRESAKVWISVGKSFQLKQWMPSEGKGSLKMSNTFDTLSLRPFHILWQPMFAFTSPFMRFDSRHLFRGFGWCPYYAARRLIHAASVVVLNYQHLASKSAILGSIQMQQDLFSKLARSSPLFSWPFVFNIVFCSVLFNTESPGMCWIPKFPWLPLSEVLQACRVLPAAKARSWIGNRSV